MRCTGFAILLFAAVAVAQPLEGPFEVITVDSTYSLRSPQAVAHGDTLEVFYTCYSPTNNNVRNFTYSMTAHQVLQGPFPIRVESSFTQRVAKVVFKDDENWALMLDLQSASRSSVHCLINYRNTLADALLDVGDYITGENFWQSRYFTYPDVHAISDSEYVASWVINGGIAMPFIEPAWMGRLAYTSGIDIAAVQDIAPACFFHGPETMNIVPIESGRIAALFTGPAAVTSTMVGIISQRNATYVDSGVRLMCDIEPLDFQRTPGGRLQTAEYGPIYNRVYRIHEVDTLGHCTELVSVPFETYPLPPVWNANFGWVFLLATSSSIRIARYDTSGFEVQPVGVLVERDSLWLINEIGAAISDNGVIAAVWTEQRTGSSNQTRMRFASVGWDTHLDTDESQFTPYPSSFTLSAYPNPFNSTLRVSYELPHAQAIELSVFNVLGQKVATLFSGPRMAGMHDAVWSPNTAGGIYFVTLKTAATMQTRKVLYLR